MFSSVATCGDGSVTCDEHALCDDTDGTIMCTCMDGYEGDGLTCAGIDLSLFIGQDVHSRKY